MMVYVNGQEITRLVLGIVAGDGSWMRTPETFAVPPEDYLRQLDAYLQAQSVSKGDIRGFVLVKGPGSATALRASHALVNTLAFALGVSVVSIEKLLDVPDGDLDLHLAMQRTHPFALPVYGQDPKITTTTRDALKRKTT